MEFPIAGLDTTRSNLAQSDFCILTSDFWIWALHQRTPIVTGRKSVVRPLRVPCR
jgi:hypothetical protein